MDVFIVGQIRVAGVGMWWCGLGCKCECVAAQVEERWAHV